MKSKQSDSEIIEMLKTNPGRFIVEKQRELKIIVNYLVGKKIIPHSEKEDVIQYINEEFLTGKLTKIIQNYSFAVPFKTYFFAVIKNLCKTYALRELPNKNTVSLKEIEDSDNKIYKENYEEKLFVEFQMERLRFLMNSYGKKKPKLLLFLKIYFKFMVSKKDLDYLEFLSESEKEESTQSLNEAIKNEQNLDKIFEKLTEITSTKKNKDKISDSDRRWCIYNIDKIVNQLNGNQSGYHFDKNSFELLFEKFIYFEQNMGRN